MSCLSFIFDSLPYPFNLLVIPFIAMIAIAAIIASGMVIRRFILFIKNEWLMYKKVIHAHDLHDEEYFYLHKIIDRFGVQQNHIPESADEEVICKNLVNHGAFIINKDGSYKITRAGKRVSHEPSILP